MLVASACCAGTSGCAGQMQNGRDGGFSPARWIEYHNAREGFRVSLPPELSVYFEKQNDREWAASNMMPFDYVNFRPQRPDRPRENIFELGIGVHWNRGRFNTRDFADRKDEGLRRSGARIEILRQSEATVAGISGVRDDFRLRQPYGWRSYIRIVVPYNDTFIVFLGTVGEERPAPGYERVFQKIVDSFALQQESLDPRDNPL